MNYGTIKCRTLRNIRKRIAELNGLKVDNKICPYEKNCETGTCPMCEMELQRLEEEIKQKSERGEKMFVEGIYTI